MKTNITYECEVCGWESDNQQYVIDCENRDLEIIDTIYLVDGSTISEELKGNILVNCEVNVGWDRLIGGLNNEYISKVDVKTLKVGDIIYRSTRYEDFQPFTFIDLKIKNHKQVLAHKEECQHGKDYDAFSTEIYADSPSWVSIRQMGLGCEKD